jgi:hypothetical protein
MEKEEQKKIYRNTTDMRTDANGSDDAADLIKTMIREMPRVAPPVGLLPSVMKVVGTKKVPLGVRFYRWATLPRSVRFTPFRLAFAAALSALLVFSANFVHEKANRSITPEVSWESIPVELSLDMPNASSVNVVGSFNDWIPQPCKLLRENDSNRWILSLRLKPGRYEYAFIVDGKHTPHPGAELSQDDGFGNQNSVLTLEREDDV